MAPSGDPLARHLANSAPRVTQIVEENVARSWCCIAAFALTTAGCDVLATLTTAPAFAGHSRTHLRLQRPSPSDKHVSHLIHLSSVEPRRTRHVLRPAGGEGRITAYGVRAGVRASARQAVPAGTVCHERSADQVILPGRVGCWRAVNRPNTLSAFCEEVAYRYQGSVFTR